LPGHGDRITAAAFSPDGRFAATASRDRTARVWSLDDGKVVATLSGHGDALTDVSFSPDGSTVLTASRDGTVRTWNARNGESEAIFRGHAGPVDKAYFSPNGRYVLTMSTQDRTVRLWGTDSGRELATLARRDAVDRQPVLTRASFNSDGTRVAVISAGDAVRVIRTFPTLEDLVEYAKTIVPRELTPCERRHFFSPIAGDVGDCPS
jgi:WD40 repeat protein